MNISDEESLDIGSNFIEIYDQPINGNLFVVGDIHGCYSMLMRDLKAIGFDFDKDLLISVGDMVDRGQESLECIQLIDQPWFKAIRGNHEQFCIEGTFDDAMKRNHADNGGEWLYQLDPAAQQEIVEKCKDLPIILEIDYRDKKYGFVHADIDRNDWEEFKQEVSNNDYFTTGSRSALQIALWSRGRIKLGVDNLNYSTVIGVDEVYLGHTPTKYPIQRQNCFFIDTGAELGGVLTIKQLGV
jgi:serine/threonine protein phosphatase 1